MWYHSWCFMMYRQATSCHSSMRMFTKLVKCYLKCVALNAMICFLGGLSRYGSYFTSLVAGIAHDVTPAVLLLFSVLLYYCCFQSYCTTSVSSHTSRQHPDILQLASPVVLESLFIECVFAPESTSYRTCCRECELPHKLTRHV